MPAFFLLFLCHQDKMQLTLIFEVLLTTTDLKGIRRKFNIYLFGMDRHNVSSFRQMTAGRKDKAN